MLDIVWHRMTSYGCVPNDVQPRMTSLGIVLHRTSCHYDVGLCMVQDPRCWTSYDIECYKAHDVGLLVTSNDIVYVKG